MRVLEIAKWSRRHWTWLTPLAAILVASAAWYVLYRPNAPLPQPLRIGFEPDPPFQMRTGRVFSGVAVDALNEAARRAGVQLKWVETGTNADEAFDWHLVDLWPLAPSLPQRGGAAHLTRPWLLEHHVMVTVAGTAPLQKDFSGKVAVSKTPVYRVLLQREFPGAELMRADDQRGAVEQVCLGNAAVAFMEERAAAATLADPPPPCNSQRLQVHDVPALTLRYSLASSSEAAEVADRLRDEIGRMYRDGALGNSQGQYHLDGLRDVWSSMLVLDSEERLKWIARTTAALLVALAVALSQAISLRQKKRTEAVLRESEARFRAIFQQAGIGVAQLTLGGRVELANERYCQVVGHDQEELVGRGTDEITHQHDTREHLAMLPRLLSGEIASFSTEKVYRKSDGTVIWANVCKTLVTQANGEPKCLIAVVEDISERKQAEAALKESEARFRNMADSAPVLIWMADHEQRRTFVNKGWLEFTGNSLEHELGEGWVESIYPEDRERCLATFALSFEQHRHFHIEYRLRRSDGEYRFVLDHGVPRVSGQREFSGYIGSAIDVTELKNAYQRHLAAQKLESLGVLSAGVAHDFNNLLGAILVRTESAQEEVDPGSPAGEDLEQIRLTALRAAEIVAQLMTFASQENGPSTLIDLSRLVSETLGLLRVSIAKNAVLQTELASDLPCIHGNPAEIRQVVMNLLINASEALEGKGGRIAVITSFEAATENLVGMVRLEIQDTGCGMTESVKARIFDPFFTTRFAGRGLGLSAVQGIVRRHGGSIQIESTPGVGSRFAILLPYASGQDPPPEPPQKKPVVASDTPAVLFIDDEDSLRIVVSKVLRRNHFRVIEVANGTAGIEFLRSDLSDVGVILMDVSLPGVSGADLLDELYRIRPNAKVILSTAYSEETAMSEIEGRRVWGFIRKPYRTNDLLNLIKEANGG